MNMDQIKDKMTEALEEIISEEFILATSDQLSACRKVLDPRAVPGRMWYNDDILVVPNGSSIRMLNYYGGFEYVAQEERTEYGEYTFFSAEDSRVARLLSVLTGNKGHNDVEADEE
jgi:hypothetical protein